MTASEHHRPTADFIMPEVHSAIAAALTTDASLQASAPARGRRSRRQVVGLSLAALAVSGTAAMAATALWAPQLGDDDRGRPEPATSPVPAGQSGSLAVLRRAQRAEDRSPKITATLKLLTSDQTDGVRLDSIRLLEQRSDGVTFLMPVERDGSFDPEYPNAQPDALCLITSFDHARAAGHPDLGLNATKKCGSLEDLRHGQIQTGGQIGRQLEISGLVPDGVASVQIVLADGESVGADVHDNFFRVAADVDAGAYEGTSVQWLDADGRRVTK